MDPAGPVPEEPGMPPPSTKKKSLASFFKQSTAINTRLTQREAIESELTSYLQSAIINHDTDPLQWWKKHADIFPALSLLAKKFLCAPATSSPSERVFSCSSNIVNCRRASLKPEAVDGLVFLAQNLQNTGALHMRKVFLPVLLVILFCLHSCSLHSYRR